MVVVDIYPEVGEVFHYIQGVVVDLGGKGLAGTPHNEFYFGMLTCQVVQLHIRSGEHINAVSGRVEGRKIPNNI